MCARPRVYVRKIVWMSIEWEWLEDVYILYIPLESIKFNVFSLPRSSVFYEITRKCFTFTYHFCWVSLFPCSNSVSYVYALRALGISQFYFVVIVTSVLNVVVFLSEFLSHCRKEEFFFLLPHLFFQPQLFTAISMQLMSFRKVPFRTKDCAQRFVDHGFLSYCWQN